MKNISTILFSTFLFISLHVNAQTTYPSGVNGCIARWTFDTKKVMLDTIHDASMNGNDGMANNLASVNGFRNKPNSAALFNGTSSWGEVPHNSILNPNQITILSLIKLNSFYSGNCQGNNIIYKGYDYNSDLSWAMYLSDNDANCSSFDPTIEKLFFHSPGLIPVSAPMSNFISTNKWYLLATRFNGTKIDHFQIEMDSIVYVSNIAPLYSQNTTNPLGSTTHDIFLGVTQNPPYKYWLNARMDEVIIFNRAITNSEIQSVYDYLWGFPTGLTSFSKPDDRVSITITNNILTVQSSGSELRSIEIYDLSGRKLKEVSVNSKQSNLLYYNSGLFLVRARLVNQTVFTKLINNY